MIRTRLLVALALASGQLACGKKSSSSAGGGGSGTANHLDGAAVSDDGDGDGGTAAVPDEETLRQGKRTGLGSPDEKPEVATEGLIRAMLGKTVAWDRFIDPARGVIELTAIGSTTGQDKLARRCGPEIASLTGFVASTLSGRLDDGALAYELSCDNSGLVVPDAEAVEPYAVCSVESPADDQLVYHLVFVTDPTRGLRLAGVSTIDAGADPSRLDDFDRLLGDNSGRCP